jgi:hypothetical protein
MILRRTPYRDDTIPVLKETHTRPDRVIRTATEAVITQHPTPWIDNSFHIQTFAAAKVLLFSDIYKKICTFDADLRKMLYRFENFV